MPSVVIVWPDDSAWALDIPEDSGIVVTNTGDVQRLTTDWYYDELNNFADKCQKGVAVRVIPEAESALRMYINRLNHDVTQKM